MIDLYGKVVYTPKSISNLDHWLCKHVCSCQLICSGLRRLEGIGGEIEKVELSSQ